MYSSGYDSMVEVCVASAMTSMRNMTTEQLQELLYDNSKIDNIIDNLAQVRSLPSEREAGLAQNKSLAEWNLSQEPKLADLRKQVKETYDNSVRLKAEVEQLKQQLDGCSSERSLDTTSSLLQVAAQEADDDAEELAQKFEDGSLSVDLFLNDFLEKKTAAHLRKIKSERLTGLLRDQQYASPINVRPGASGSSNPPYPAYPNVGAPSSNRHSFW